MLSSESKRKIIQLQASTSRQVKIGQHWLLMGSTGSGKTTAGKMIDWSLGKLYPDVAHFILDTQHTGDFDEYEGLVQGDRAPRTLPKKGQYQIWQPLLRHPIEIEKWLWGIFDNPPSFVLIDELFVLKYKGVGNFSDAYSAIQRAGRGKHITCVTHTQKLGKIPTDAYEQATHRLGFYMEGTYNRYIRSEMLKYERCPQPDDMYGFHYQHKDGRGEPEYYRDIQDFLGVRRR